MIIIVEVALFKMPLRFHAKMWALARKNKFGGQARTNFVALDHNFGYKKESLLQKINFTSTQ